MSITRKFTEIFLNAMIVYVCLSVVFVIFVWADSNHMVTLLVRSYYPYIIFQKLLFSKSHFSETLQDQRTNGPVNAHLSLLHIPINMFEYYGI